jgi:hypothetical protein
MRRRSGSASISRAGRPRLMAATLFKLAQFFQLLIPFRYYRLGHLDQFILSPRAWRPFHRPAS